MQPNDTNDNDNDDNHDDDDGNDNNDNNINNDDTNDQKTNDDNNNDNTNITLELYLATKLPWSVKHNDINHPTVSLRSNLDRHSTSYTAPCLSNVSLELLLLFVIALLTE